MTDNSSFVGYENLVFFATLDLTVSSDPVFGEPLLYRAAEDHGPSLNLHPGQRFAHWTPGASNAQHFSRTWG